MIELLFAIPTLIVAALWVYDKRCFREAEQAWRLERVGLLNRIQAPELVAAQAAPPPSDSPLYVPFEDDAAHDEYIEQRSAGEVV